MTGANPEWAGWGDPGPGEAVPEGAGRLLPGAATADSPRQREEVGWQGQGTVLLVDDEPAVLDVSARLLRALGCRVLAANSGEEALARFRRHRGEVRLAVVDLSMPLLSGEETLRQLRRLEPALPLVLMSGYAEADVAPRLADLPLAGYLQKPFRLPALEELLRRLLPG